MPCRTKLFNVVLRKTTVVNANVALDICRVFLLMQFVFQVFKVFEFIFVKSIDIILKY